MEPQAPKERVRCRAITAGDLDRVATLLAQGFPGRPRTWFEAGLIRMSVRDIPPGAQRYGFCLDAGSGLVGVILLIASQRETEGEIASFYNVASWYVEPPFRPYAQLLVSIALRNKDFTYTNVSAAPHTWDVVKNQGYQSYCGGLFFAAALLTKPRAGVTVEAFDPELHMRATEFSLLNRHQAMGCEVTIARHGDRLSGYVFRRFRMRSGHIALPALFVLHAPSREELIDVTGNLGRHFLQKVAPILVMDADGPVAGLSGFYTERRGRKFFKGTRRPKLCDLADTEYAIFGL